MNKPKVIPYNPKLVELAKHLRNNSTKSEVILWNYLKGKKMLGIDFTRQKPIDSYIVDFFCSKLMLAIEIDGYSHQLEEVYAKDVEKSRRLEELGIKLFRFQDVEVFQNIKGVLQVIENTILELSSAEE